MKTCSSYLDVKKPEHAVKLFIRFALAKGAVGYGLELMMALFLSYREWYLQSCKIQDLVGIQM